MTACGTKPEQTEENTVETDTFDSYEFIPGEDYIHWVIWCHMLLLAWIVDLMNIGNNIAWFSCLNYQLNEYRQQDKLNCTGDWNTLQALTSQI